MSDRSEYVRVRDRKNGLERDVTRKAYQILGPRRYELLSEDVEIPTRSAPQKKSVKVAEPAEGEFDVQINPVIETTANPTGSVTVVRKKPGPKPKNNA